MNDPQIRYAFHNKFLKKEHKDIDTLVIDEFGLQHGKIRADIAVINGHINGFEIKSDTDSLTRLHNQIDGYNAVFDYSSIILTDNHFFEASKLIPDWWGIVLVSYDQFNGITFHTIKQSKLNNNIDSYSTAQLLWRDEVQEILVNHGIERFKLNEKRENLYKYLTDMVNTDELRIIVRRYLKNRRDWRNLRTPFPNGGLYQPISML